MSYYNTNSEVGEQLNKAVKAANVQTQKVYNVLKDEGIATAWHLRKSMTIEVFGAVIESPLITSIRRSLNTLEKQGKVRKVEQVRNHFGRKEWTWAAL